MANEFSISAALTLRKNYLNKQVSDARNLNAVTSAPAYVAGSPSIGTTHEAIPMGDVATQGWAFFKNLDATNFVTIGIVVTATYYPMLKLKAGEFVLVRLSTNTIYAKADTAACQLDFIIFDD